MYSTSELKRMSTPGTAARIEHNITDGEGQPIGSGNGRASKWDPRAAVGMLAKKACWEGLNAAVCKMHSGDHYEVVASSTGIYGDGKTRVG